MPQTINTNFNPETVILAGSNLIEASAGTGKTYSIAILTLRLIIEKNIPIEKILMVTFTKAAVAELETRVRSFVRLALKVSRGEDIEDKTIERMVKAQMVIQNEETVTVEDKLSTAQDFLDETSVLTIHSFCQRTLSEFSFETSQIFGAETITPDEFNQITEDAFNKFWRERITTIKTELLELMLASELKHEEVLKLVKQAFGGKMLVTNLPIPNNFLDLSYQENLLQEVIDENDEIRTKTNNVIDYLVANKANLMPEITRTENPRKAFERSFNEDNWYAVIATIYEKNAVGYVGKIFKDILEDVKQIGSFRKDQKRKFDLIVNNIAVEAIHEVQAAILKVKSNF